MKASLFASGLVLGTLASSAVANPLEVRAPGTRTITKTATTTQTDTVTKYKTKTRTVTETETEIINRTRTKTVVSSTTLTVNRPTTTTKTSTRNVPGPTTTKTVVSSTTLVVNRPTTVYKTSTAVVTTSLPPMTVLSTKTTVSTKTLPVSVSTQIFPASTITSTRFLPASTIVSTKLLPASTIVSTQTLPASISTKTLPVSVSTKVIPASTIVSTKSVQIAGPTVTQTSTIKGSTVFAPAQTVTSVSTREIPGPTITDLSIATITAVSTTYINNGNGTCGSPSSIDSRNMTSSAPPFPTLTATTSFGNLNLTASATSTLDNFNNTMTATSSSAPASSTAASFANVKTTTCDSAPAYYIQVDGTGTKVDGTVLCNQGGPNSGGSWMYMYQPASAQTLGSLGVGPMIPQPFTYDRETGDLVSYWNSGESLVAYETEDTRAGYVYSGDRDPPLSCGLEGSTLTPISNEPVKFEMGVRVEGDGNWLAMLRVKGGDDYDADNTHDATFSLIPACDLGDGGSSSSSTTSSPSLTTASSTSSSAAATSIAPVYMNVKTAECDNPKGYYIEISDTGTHYDGTVMLNLYANARNMWVAYSRPISQELAGGSAPQPFNFDSSTGQLVTTWSTGEWLAFGRDPDNRYGYVYSSTDWNTWNLTCSMTGDQLTDCYSTHTPSDVGLRLDASNGMLRVAGGYDYESAQDATFRLIPACDI